MSGKGDSYRPVDGPTYRANFERALGQKAADWAQVEAVLCSVLDKFRAQTGKPPERIVVPAYVLRQMAEAYDADLCVMTTVKFRGVLLQVDPLFPHRFVCACGAEPEDVALEQGEYAWGVLP